MVPALRVLESFDSRRIATSLILVVLFSSSVFVQSTNAAAGSMEVQVQYDRAKLQISNTDDGVRYDLAGTRHLYATGAPELPYDDITLVLPQGSRIQSVELVEAEWMTLERPASLTMAKPMTPSEGMAVEEDMGGLAQEWVARSAVFPAASIRHGNAAMLHGYHLGKLELIPMRVSVDGKVELLTRGVIRVELAGHGIAEPALRSVDWPGSREHDARRLRQLVHNPESVSIYAPAPGRRPDIASSSPSKSPNSFGPDEVFAAGEAEYVIITPSSFAGEFQRLADDHIAHGLPTRVVTTEWIEANYPHGVDRAETYRLYLKEAYALWGARFVLLGGDSGVMPARYVRSTYYPAGEAFTDIPCDLYFGALDGNYNADGDGVFGEHYQSFEDEGDEQDMYAELFVGRAPVNDLAQAQTFVDKCIEYQNPVTTAYLGKSLYLSEVLFPAAWDGVTPPALDGATYSEDIIFNSIITPGNLIESFRLYENYVPYFGSEPESKQAAIDSMNTGRFGLVNHVGHGFYYNMSVANNNIVVGDADDLTNGANAFVLYALNCSSGAFDFDCLLERFIQNPNGGSVVSIGSCRAAFPTTANNYQQAFYDQIFVQGVNRIGEAMSNSRDLFTPSFNNERPERWTHFTYTLLGDPAMRMWRKPGSPCVASYPTNLTLGEENVLVHVTSSGADVEGARVTLHKAGETYATGVTDVLGQVTLPVHTLTTGSMDIVIADASLHPFRSTITIDAAAAAHVRVAPNNLDDGAGGNGLADSGEIVSWYFDFENNGGTLAPGASAVLVAVDAVGATISDADIAVGDLSTGALLSPNDPVVIALDPSIVDGETLSFDLVTTSGVDTWTQRVEMQVLSPEPTITRLLIDDSALGNGDGIVQSGETVDLVFTLTNYGAGTSSDLAGVLSTSSPNLTLIDANNDWGDLALKQMSTGVGSFRVTESDASIENLMLLTLTDSKGHSWEHSIELRAPVAPNDPEINPALGPTTLALLWDSPAQAHLRGYRVYRGDSVSGPFSEITIDLLEGSGYYQDEGLTELTRYFYQVAAVDSSGVEGPTSGVVSASTSPPELAGGFPYPMSDGVAGATAVGDLLGNGTNVMVAGSGFVYVIDSNGNEILDGDQDSQTLGPISGLGDTYTPSGVSMANMDAEPGLEILASSWHTDEIYIFDADGSVLPGWPQSMHDKAWATPSIADLDNDGDPEVVVNNVTGRTYVWHHDGSELRDGDSNAGTNGVFVPVRSGEIFNRSTPALFDVDGDGNREIIFGTNFRGGTDNQVHAYKLDGSEAPGWPVSLGSSGYTVASLIVADLNNDSIAELILPCENDSLYVWEPDGTRFPGFPIYFRNQGGDLSSKAPNVAVADFDFDSDLEMVAVSITGSASCQVYILDHDGTPWPGWPQMLPGLSESTPVIGDLNGDYVPDVVFGIGGGSDGAPNLLAAFNSDGTPVAGFPIYMAGAVRSTPVITDFDLDGDVDVVLAGIDREMHVWDMPWAFHPASTPWPTFGGNVQRTGVYGELLAVSVEEDPGTSAARKVVLHHNKPNPFNPSTVIRFEIPGGRSASVQLDVFDLAGRRVRRLLQGDMPSGSHEARWNGRDGSGRVVASGIYFARLRVDEEIRTIKMTLAK